MSALTGKRITYKRLKPNPLFEECLEKLYKEAKENNSKYEPILKEAMSSLVKYPLPLKSGADCAILKGFNRTLCLLLDKYLLDNGNSSKENLDHKSTHNSEEKIVDVETVLRINSDQIFECNININDNQSSLSNSTERQIYESPSKNGSCSYKPAVRSGGYAILMGLLEHSKRNLGNTLKKDELIEIAQKYCEESLTVSKSVRYSAWSSMTRLITKGLVKKSRSKKVEYTLTEEGAMLASRLWEENANKPSINDVIFNKSPNKILSSQHLSLKEPHNLLTINVEKNNDTENVELSDHVINMPANSFDIILLIDKNENNGTSNKHDPFRIYPDLKYESRSLKVGDFTWIAKHKTNNWELVLPYIIERKRMDDLGASIKDGRFHEQKFRLKKCGLGNVLYLVESHDKNKHVGLPMPSLMQALTNTRIQDGFNVYFTDSLMKTHKFLAMMTKRLEVEYMNKSLHGTYDDSINGMLMTFDYFNKSSVKTKVLNVTEMFIKMLLQLKGMSVEKALAITNVYRTPKALLTAYESCDEKQGSTLLANLKYGDLNRNVGPSVSKAIFQLFTFH